MMYGYLISKHKEAMYGDAAYHSIIVQDTGLDTYMCRKYKTFTAKHHNCFTRRKRMLINNIENS